MKKINRAINTIENVSTLAFFIMIIVIILQIGYRYFGLSLPWTEELARVSLVWSVFLGSLVALVKRDHIRVEIIDRYLSVLSKKIYNIINDLLSLIFVVFWSFGAYIIFISNLNIPLVSINTSTGYAFYLLPFLIACSMGLLLILRIIVGLLNIKSNQKSNNIILGGK